MLAALALALPGFAGCSMDDVQLNGKVFDAMGMNTTGSVRKGDPKMAAREPLVVPPGLDLLPPPGSGKEAQPTLAEIQDPDRNQKVSKAELEKQQAEYCKVHYDQARAQGDNNADLATGPLGTVPTIDILGRQEVDEWRRRRGRHRNAVTAQVVVVGKQILSST